MTGALRRGVLIALGALLLTLAAATPATGKEIKRCNGQGMLCDRPFNEVVIAASHNAMSSASLGWLLPNQSVAIPEQLAGGIRGLLIDTHYGRLRDDGTVVTDDEGKVSPDVGPRSSYLCHVLCELGATKLTKGLREIRRFLRARPNNVLLIENEDYIDPANFAKAVERSGLIDFVYEGPTDRWPTLREMIASKQQVVFLADNRGGSIPWYHETYAGILQETPYRFEQPSELTDPRNWRKSCGPNRGDVTGSMFLMNHWSPPTPAAEPDTANYEEVNKRSVIFNRARTCADVRGRLPSIIAADHVNIGGLREAVRDLNGRGITGRSG
jgi:hypothetical protein